MHQSWVPSTGSANGVEQGCHFGFLLGSHWRGSIMSGPEEVAGVHYSILALKSSRILGF